MSIPSLLATLLERLETREALEVEFKRARGGLPKDLWSTVSAFANTNGGWIILGIDEQGEEPVVEGVENARHQLKTFHDLVRNPQKISIPVCGVHDAAIERLDDKQVLVIRVPAASRRDRPVYINGNPYTGTYVRRHAADYRCTKPEVDRMMRDASDETADTAVLHNFGLDDLDPDALAGYRRRFQTLHPASPWNAYDDVRFLTAIGAFRRDRETGTEGLTVAGLLLLGRSESIRDWRTRHLIDFRAIAAEGSDADERWADRVAWEGNLLGAFDTIYPRLTAGLATPFRLEGATRRDESPAHTALREALTNLLVHADYAEPQASLILMSSKGYTFRNPGSSRVPETDLLAGNRSDPRNPVLLRMFRLIGIADEAGTGIPKITQTWRELGLQLPKIDPGTERYEFSLELHSTHLLADDDRAWLLAIGNDWTEAEQLALVHARHAGYIDNLKLRQMTGQHPADTTKVLVSLRDRGLLEMTRSGRGARYVLGPAALKGRQKTEDDPGEVGLGPLFVEVAASSGEPTPSSGRLPTSSGSLQPSSGSLPPSSDSLPRSSGGLPSSTNGLPQAGGSESNDFETVWEELETIARPVCESRYVNQSVLDATLIRLCQRTALSLRELIELTGKSEATVRKSLRRLLRSEQLRYLYPDQPQHPRQKYVV